MDCPHEMSHEDMMIFLKEAYLSGAKITRVYDEPLGPEKFHELIYQGGEIVLTWPHDTYAFYGLSLEGWQLRVLHALP